MITVVNETKRIKNICDCKCKFTGGKLIPNQKWDNVSVDLNVKSH